MKAPSQKGITNIGAEGIDICPGANILIADSAAEFAQALIHLLRQPAAANVIAQAGRQWVEQRYNWRTIYAAWDHLYSANAGNKERINVG